MVGILKHLLLKILDCASLNYENLVTVICDREAVINSRTLTYFSSDSNELMPLTPAMFLREQEESDVPDCDDVDKRALCRKLRHRQKLLEDLRRRFRNEYLGQLKLWCSTRDHRQISVGEVVLIGNDQDKRLNWPIGRVTELIAGKDGQVRLVKVVTERGQILRPVQRLYPLECLGDVFPLDDNCLEVPDDGTPGEQPQHPSLKTSELSECAEKSVAEAGVSKSRVPDSAVIVKRSGRKVVAPKRFSDVYYCTDTNR